MSRPRLLTAAVALATAVVLALPAHAWPAASTSAPDPAPDAQVHVSSRAHEGPRGTIVASLRARCAPGLVFVAPTLDWRQGEVVTPSTSGAPVTCDGRWHRQTVGSFEAFEGGPAHVRARLDVVDPATGRAGAPGLHVTRIYVRPAAVIRLPGTARLLPGGGLRITTRARCDTPWLLQSYGLDAQQGEFPDLAAGGGDHEDQPVCDGAYHRVSFVLGSVQPVGFRRGWAQVSAQIVLLDRVDFDPIASAHAAGRVWVR